MDRRKGSLRLVRSAVHTAFALEIDIFMCFNIHDMFHAYTRKKKEII